jgi:tRNA pseudouridine38-40 synthase
VASPLAGSPAGGLVRVRLDVSYDGTAYAGWARQPGRPTVAGTLERALATAVGQPVAMRVAGRTDAGVHATGQVATMDLPETEWLRVAPTLADRLAGLLPADVRVRALAAVPAGFDARFSALSRCYGYRISDARWGVEPLRRVDTWDYRRAVDLDRLRAASAPLVGEHDFAAYCRRRDGATTIRQLLRLDWHRDDAAVLVATVEADAFCHSMVRSLIGALVAVGAGRRQVDWAGELLRARARDSPVPVAPARGLTLLAVRYPPVELLADRARLTRAVRVPKPELQAGADRD